MAAKRYEQNDNFFVKMFENEELLNKVIETIGYVLYDRLRTLKGGEVNND